MKIAATEARVMAAEPNATPPPTTVHKAGAKTSPMDVGMALWKTIAPVILPIASVSLPRRTHRTLLSVSGSSVAIGAMTSASRVPFTPGPDATSLIAWTKVHAPPTMQARAKTTCTETMSSRGGSGCCGAPRSSLWNRRG